MVLSNFESKFYKEQICEVSKFEVLFHLHPFPNKFLNFERHKINKSEN